MNNWADFLDAVEQMRLAQKEYFRTRTLSALATSKALETEVDKAIKAHHQRQAQRQNPGLFGEGQ